MAVLPTLALINILLVLTNLNCFSAKVTDRNPASHSHRISNDHTANSHGLSQSHVIRHHRSEHARLLQSKFDHGASITLRGVERSATWPDVTQRPPLSLGPESTEINVPYAIGVVAGDGQQERGWTSRYKPGYYASLLCHFRYSEHWIIPYNLVIACRIFKLYVFYSVRLLKCIQFKEINRRIIAHLSSWTTLKGELPFSDLKHIQRKQLFELQIIPIDFTCQLEIV